MQFHHYKLNVLSCAMTKQVNFTVTFEHRENLVVIKIKIIKSNENSVLS